MKDYIIIAAFIIIFVMLAAWGAAIMSEKHTELDKSIEEVGESFVRLINSAVTRERMFIELCTDPHNKAVCDRYEAIMRERHEETN